MMWIRCPMYARAVATGIEIHPASFLRLPERLDNFQCAACGQRHQWLRREAWLAESPGGPTGRPRLTSLLCSSPQESQIRMDHGPGSPLVTYTLH
jgi:hypothetical protein